MFMGCNSDYVGLCKCVRIWWEKRRNNNKSTLNVHIRKKISIYNNLTGKIQIEEEHVRLLNPDINLVYIKSSKRTVK